MPVPGTGGTGAAHSMPGPTPLELALPSVSSRKGRILARALGHPS